MPVHSLAQTHGPHLNPQLVGYRGTRSQTNSPSPSPLRGDGYDPDPHMQRRFGRRLSLAHGGSTLREGGLPDPHRLAESFSHPSSPATPRGASLGVHSPAPQQRATQPRSSLAMPGGGVGIPSFGGPPFSSLGNGGGGGGGGGNMGGNPMMMNHGGAIAGIPAFNGGHGHPHGQSHSHSQAHPHAHPHHGMGGNGNGSGLGPAMGGMGAPGYSSMAAGGLSQSMGPHGHGMQGHGHGMQGGLGPGYYPGYGSPALPKQMSAPSTLALPPPASPKSLSPHSPRSFSPILPGSDGAINGSGLWERSRTSGNGSPKMSPSPSMPSKQPWPKNLDDELKALGTFEAAKERFDWILQHCSPLEATEKERNEVYAKGFMALGGVAKQHGRIAEARHCYNRARSMAKTFPTAWSSAAKFEEEMGLHQRSLAIVEEGLEFCRNSYLLIRKRVELVELLSGPAGARRVLARLPQPLHERDWKCWSHGALLEARYGRPRVAQAVYACLRAVVRPKSQHYGKLCEDIVKFQERQGLYLNAVCTARVVYDLTGQQNGLWFALLRLQERLGAPITDQHYVVFSALGRVSHDVTWKLWFLLAQFQDRAHEVVAARTSLAQAVATCSVKDHWKIWAGAARIELANDNPAAAELLLLYALKYGPQQRQLSVLLDLARLAEHERNLDMARGLLQLAPVFDRSDCRVPMELMLLEFRAGRLPHALAYALTALDDVVPSGRFWGILIHLSSALSPATQRRVIAAGLQSVPKSGEIWCELGRWALNLHNRIFSVPLARQVLDVALHFTPQYGDSFIEYVRVELLSRGYTHALGDVRRHCIHAAPNYGMLWNYCRLHAAFDARLIFDTAFERVCSELTIHRSLYAHRLVAHIRVRPGTSPECLVEGRPMAQLCARQSERCRMCRTVLTHKHVVVLACGHFFHEVCAKRFAMPQVVAGPAAEAKCCPLCSEPWCVIEYYVPFDADAARRPTSAYGGRSMPGSPAPGLLHHLSSPLPGTPQGYGSAHSGVYPQFSHSTSMPGTSVASALPPQFGASQLSMSHASSPSLYPGTPGCSSPVPNQFGSPLMARHGLGSLSPKRGGSPAFASGPSTSPAPGTSVVSPEEHAWLTAPLPPPSPPPHADSSSAGDGFEDLCDVGAELLGLVPPAFRHSCAIMEVHAVCAAPTTEVTSQARRQLLFGPEYDVLSKL